MIFDKNIPTIASPQPTIQIPYPFIQLLVYQESQIHTFKFSPFLMDSEFTK